MANEDARVQNILNSLLTTYQVPYNIMTGLNSQSQGLYGNQQQSDNGLFGAIAGAVGNIAGSDWFGDALKIAAKTGLGYVTGGPAGAAAGAGSSLLG